MTFAPLPEAALPEAFDTWLRAVDSGAQPLDSDLTAIAALTTTEFGRSLLTQAVPTTTNLLAASVAGSDAAIRTGRTVFQVTAAGGWPGTGIVEVVKVGSLGVFQTFRPQTGLGSWEVQTRHWINSPGEWSAWRRVDGFVRYTMNDVFTMSTPGPDFPVGHTIFPVTAVGGGWPDNGFVEVVRSTSVAQIQQRFHGNHGGKSLHRAWSSTASAWVNIGRELVQDALDASSPLSAFPTGVSSMRGSSAGGWPTLQGAVVTTNIDGRGGQMWQPTSGPPYFRAAVGDVWGTWARVGGQRDQDSLGPGAPIGDWPMGHTSMRTHTPTNTLGAWPHGMNGQVHTYKSASVEATQEFYGRPRWGDPLGWPSFLAPTMLKWRRFWSVILGKWTDWQELDPVQQADPDLRALDVDSTVAQGTDPMFVGTLADGTLIGMRSSPTRIYLKADPDAAWPGTPTAEIAGANKTGGLFQTGDGGWLAVLQEDGAWKGSPGPLGSATWAKKVTPSTQADDRQAGIIGNSVGQMGLHGGFCEVLRGAFPWTASRYMWVTDDAFETVTAVIDINAELHEDAHAHLVHPFQTRTGRIGWFLTFHTATEPKCAVVWKDELDGLSTPIHYPADFGAMVIPMTADTLPNGKVVFGSDDRPSGLYSVTLDDDVDRMRLKWLHIPLLHTAALTYIARGSVVDPATGILYVAFRSSVAGHEPIIMATDGETAEVVWRWDGMDSGTDRAEEIGISDGRVVCRLLPGGGDPSVLTAQALRWRPGRPYFRRQGSDWVYTVGLPSGDVIDLGAPS